MKKVLLIILFMTIFSSLSAPERRVLWIHPGKEIHFIRPSDLYQRLLIMNIRYPRIVWRQIMLETGYMTSRISIEAKNLFGMKHNHRGFSQGEIYGHALYETYCQSLADYKDWQDRYYKGGDYYEFLQRIGYAEDRLYVDKLKRIEVIGKTR